MLDSGSQSVALASVEEIELKTNSLVNLENISTKITERK